jgi:hypothetical protein
MAVQIQLRNDTAANWTTENPTLAAGEVGVETDTGSVKVGDGTTAWTSLGYFGVGSAYVDSAVANLVDSAPSTLDTLNELAAALSDDPDFATTITNSIAGKANTSHTHAISDVTNLQASLDDKTDKLQPISAKTANYTLQQSDNQALISCDGTFTITLPTLSAGTRIDILNIGTGTISFNNDAGAPFINGAEFTGFPSIDTQWAAASVLYLSSGNAAIVGKIA